MMLHLPKSPLSYVIGSVLALATSGCHTDNPTPRHPGEPPATSGAPPVPAYTAVPESVVKQTCAGKTRRAADGLIDDLEDGNHQVVALAGRDGYWFTSKAPSATIKIPVGDFKPVAGGPAGSKQMAYFSGTTAYKDSWGAVIGVGFLASGGFYDASKYAGIGFKIKGSKAGLNVRLKLPDAASLPEGGLCKECWNSFGKELILTSEWQDVALQWSELTQQPDWGVPRPPQINPAKLKNAEWSLYPGVEFDFNVDDVHFLECE
jgi:hypothetical protein